MTTRRPRLTPRQIDAASKRLRELGLVAPGATLSEDGSFGDNLRDTFAWLAEKDGGLFKENIFYFMQFLSETLKCGSEYGGAEPTLLQFMLRLPDGHHVTPGRRIDMVAYIIVQQARLEGYNLAGLVLNGTAPPDGYVDRLLDWWETTGSRRITPSVSHEWYLHLESVMCACGFTSVADVRRLGRELHEAEQEIAFPDRRSAD